MKKQVKELFRLIKEFWELTKDDKKDMMIAITAVMFYRLHGGLPKMKLRDFL